MGVLEVLVVLLLLEHLEDLFHLLVLEVQ